MSSTSRRDALAGSETLTVIWTAPGATETFRVEPAEEPGLSPQDEQHIERLFEQALQDRSKAYELKRELDRLEVFPEYEDRFLDLFKKPE